MSLRTVAWLGAGLGALVLSRVVWLWWRQLPAREWVGPSQVSRMLWEQGGACDGFPQTEILNRLTTPETQLRQAYALLILRATTVCRREENRSPSGPTRPRDWAPGTPALLPPSDSATQPHQAMKVTLHLQVKASRARHVRLRPPIWRGPLPLRLFGWLSASSVGLCLGR